VCQKKERRTGLKKEIKQEQKASNKRPLKKKRKLFLGFN
jgi:hypothetical protein